ncbi:hypothetical protein [Chitinophaga rhizosphaerae]|uniref:hypothetical protein n=1 Tax=Chitinophaga rhizosphaerae TaxID=1864947 RepID=UPI0013DFFC0A|nr:hypothetical protein [Chitinophaga rhizosphaerae]
MTSILILVDEKDFLDFHFLDDGQFNVARLQCAEEKRLRLPADAEGADAALANISPIP